MEFRVCDAYSFSIAIGLTNMSYNFGEYAKVLESKMPNFIRAIKNKVDAEIVINNHPDEESIFSYDATSDIINIILLPHVGLIINLDVNQVNGGRDKIISELINFVENPENVKL